MKFKYEKLPMESCLLEVAYGKYTLTWLMNSSSESEVSLMELEPREKREDRRERGRDGGKDWKPLSEECLAKIYKN